MRHFSRTVLRNSTFGLAAQFAIKLLSFAFSVLVIRKLGADAFGQYAAVGAFGAIFVFIGDLGLSPYMVRQVARWRAEPGGHERAEQLFGTVLEMRLLLSLLAAVLIILTAWLTRRPAVMVGAIMLNAVALILYGVEGTSEAALSGFERLDLSSGPKVANQFVFVLAGGAALWLGFGYYGLIVANLLGVALMTYLCWRGVRRLQVWPRPATRAAWRGLLRASLPFGIIGFALGLSYKFDSVLLNIFRGDAETGYYNAAYNLVFSAVVFSNVINTAFYPSLARQAVSDPQRLPFIYERAFRYLLVLSLPIAFGIWAVAEQVVPFLFKSAFSPAIPALQIIIWVVPLMYASEFLGYIVVISGQERRVALAIVVSSSFNVAINLLLVPRLGLIGAALLTVITEIVLVGQYLWILRKLIRGFNWNHLLVRPLLAASVMAMLVRAGQGLPLIALILGGAAIYGGLLLALRVMGPEEFQFVQGLLHKTAEST